MNIKHLICCLVMCYLPSAGASDLDDKAFAAAIHRAFPSWPQVENIRPSPVNGLIEFTVGGQLKYADPQGSVIVEGQMFAAASKRNLSQERMAEIGRIPWSELPHRLAMKTRVNGNGSRKIMVFADPNCSACHMLEAELAKVPDITVYTTVIPILGPASVARARQIACSSSPETSWVSWMIRRQDIPAASDCPAKFDEALHFASSRGIFATPQVFLEDGSKLMGAVPAKELDARLAGVRRQ